MLDFLSTAGPFVWGIMGTSIVMWWMIARCYTNQSRGFHKISTDSISKLFSDHNLNDKEYRHVCRTFLNQSEQRLNSGIAWVSVLVKLLPLLGLLGTVDGMISSFQQLDQWDIQRQLSGGISQALLTTLSGLVTSLSGLYFVHNLQQRKRRCLATLRLKIEVNNALSS